VHVADEEVRTERVDLQRERARPVRPVDEERDSGVP
jgi:hypothetical protein